MYLDDYTTGDEDEYDDEFPMGGRPDEDLNRRSHQMNQLDLSSLELSMSSNANAFFALNSHFDEIAAKHGIEHDDRYDDYF